LLQRKKRKMKKQKRMMLGMFLLFAILFSTFASAASFSNPQLFSPGGNSFSYLGGQGINFPAFNSNQCQKGNDFIVQVAPFGCTPSVVRSDLLEDQNVPVFCQLYATKINPLISVNAIDFISFNSPDGKYPEEIAGIGFHPAQAALRSTSTTLLNSPILQNIGYAVIVLKQQKNESSMPDFVSGNLTANIKYDIENAFGVGQATQYLPELTEQQWNENYAKSSFWNGKGFLRVQGIDNTGATISIYSDSINKISTFSLQKGETSGEVYLPGLYCQAGLKVRLDDVQSPDTRARLNINGEIVEVVQGEKFLNNQCTANLVEAKGLSKKVQIGCRTDDGFERLDLQINPKIKLEITDAKGNAETKDFGLGDKVYTTDDGLKSVYLAYIGTKDNSENVDDLYLYFLKMPYNQENLTGSDLASANFLVKSLTYSRVTSSGIVNWAAYGTKLYVGAANTLYQKIKDGRDFVKMDYKKDMKSEEVMDRKIKILGLSEAGNSEFTDGNAKEYYDKAIIDYRQIIEKLANEKENQDSQETFGMQAFEKSIKLSSQSSQKKTLSDLCKEFKDKYPKESQRVSTDCGGFQIVNTASSMNGVVINGKTKIISLEDVSEPSLDDFSAEILVKKPNGNVEQHLLTKNEVLTLNENPQGMFEYKLPSPITSAFSPSGQTSDRVILDKIYFSFFDSKWHWSADALKNKVWMDVDGKIVSKESIWKNTELKDKNAKMIENLKGNLADGKDILIKNNAVEKSYEGGNDYIQLLNLNEDSARIRVNFRGAGTEDFFTNEVVLRKNVGNTERNYIFTL